MNSKSSIGFFKNNNRRNLVLFLGLFLFLAFMATVIASFFVSRVSVREAIISHELPLTSDTIYSEIQNDILLPLYISSTMANDTFLRDWVIDGEQDLTRIKRYLSEIKSKYGTVSSFFISEKTRRYYYSGGILKTVRDTEPRDKWYFRVRQMKNAYEINVDPDMANRDTITIFINYKVFDFNNNYIGATGVGLTMNKLKRRLRDYKNRYRRNVYFVDGKGTVVLYNPDDNSRFEDGENIRNIEGLKSIADKVLQDKTASLEYQLNGRTILLNVRYIPELKWYLMVEQDTARAIQPLRNVLYFNVAIGMIVTLIVIVTVAVMVLRFQQNLEARNQTLETKNHEITEQRRQLETQTRNLSEINERLELLNQEKDEFLGIAAHDLRSPLSGIVTAIELISNEECSAEEQKLMMDQIHRTSANLLDLLNNLLDITAIEMTTELEETNTDFRQAVSNAVKTFDLHARAKQITIQTRLPEIPLPVRTHRDWLTHIINNLISNAVKYSPEQTVVDIRLEKTDAAVRLMVSDQGPGLTLEDKKILFTRFARLSARPTGEESSSGLGLYIVRKLTERLGGTVWCESEYGVGSRFMVELPLAEAV